MFQTRKTLFGHIWLKKSKLSVKTEILYQETYLNMRNSMMMLTFSQFLTGNTFLSKFDPKNKDCQFELRFCSRLILICRIMQKLCGVHFFCFRPFWVNMKNSIVMFIFLCFRLEVYVFLEICSKHQNCFLRLKLGIQTNLNMQNLMVIFFSFSLEIPFLY